MPVTRPKVRDGLAVVELDGEAVIYVEETGDLHHLNPTATIVFGLCDGTATMREISSEIAAAFRMPAEEIEGQVRELVRRLRRANLLEPARRATTSGTVGNLRRQGGELRRSHP